MLFDLKKFLSAGNSPAERRFVMDLSDRDFAGAKVTQPVQAVFTAERAPGEAHLHLTATAQVSGECARCLAPVVQQEEIDAEWVVRERDLADADFELPIDEKGVLDVSEWLFQEFSLQIPTVLLCSPDCLGLCPVCGKRRQDCTCPKAAESTSADARLSILKTLLN